jgi:hypothetical protein
VLSTPDGLSLVISRHSFVFSCRAVARADDLRQAGDADLRIATRLVLARWKRPPAVCRSAFRDQNLFAMKCPLSPGVAILNKGACGLRLHLNVRCEIFAGVLSRSLIVNQANSAAPPRRWQPDADRDVPRQR